LSAQNDETNWLGAILKKRILLLGIMLFFVLPSPAFPKSYAFVDALVWNARQSNATNWGQVLTPLALNERIIFLEAPFKYKPGVRAGFGYTSPLKPWDVVFYYTGYQTNAQNQVSTNSSEVHSAFSSNFYANNPQGNGISGPFYRRAGIKWDITYNTLDLELGRSLAVDSWLVLRPLIGLRAATINQTINSNWHEPFEPTTSKTKEPTPITTFNFATERITNDFKGLGPSIGLDTTWNFYNSPKQTLSLLGKASAAFLWSHWNFSDVYQNQVQRISTQSDALWSCAWMTKLFLGLDASTVHAHARWNLRLGYEIQAWFNQLQYYSFDMGKTNDTLFLQGALVGIGVHFN
jgi:hypothetical protein